MSLKSTLHTIGRGLYDAETVGDAGRTVLQALPAWVPWVGAGACITAYVVTFRVRLFIARWRRAARWRVERKYMALGFLHDYAQPPGMSFTLVGEDEEDEDGEDGDATALKMSDIEEFCCSLGIRSPRDDDLLLLVEEMLLVDPIPDGWVLYRTTAGLVRFMNVNTQELFFFHPGKLEEERRIRAELKLRNRVVMEAKFNFLGGDEESGRRNGNNYSFSLRKQRHKKFSDTCNACSDSTGGGGATLSFSDDGDNEVDGRDEQSTFRRLFRYFLEREERKIERDVEKKLGVLPAAGSGSLGAPQTESRSLRVLPANLVHSSAHLKRVTAS
ncbi:hypothetical protein TraAM80_07905 [Trypanosoma rangeli]|uniref:WW domain-containing protein n=1 Tax=Trypanosoma rangeli TaxID=5698 RepID=A0A3R7NBC4_TRYRA|nr:uncharacterized protein TraAM80_07905 [Trypanosoma rangeli]RNE99942.1 hypothetical protein TraAM80_07905 [Trypanosoma rangeli]|eukprot:RNE99942.1 hypothetical protein TraAM80_07905 [Trypanosoma rangeli]